ncbi:MAG: magnesium/cobalt transporter CorA [Chloroflexi bacterium]|nr:magnesium/cobalt transporter CorA [Chloroflexota bacterium]
MIRTIYRSGKGGMTTDVPEAHWKVALHDVGGLFWIDLADEPPQRVRKLLADIFHFHPLAIEGALEKASTPKVDDWGDYVYIVVHSVTFDTQSSSLETHEIDAFLGKNFLVTHHKNPMASADHVWKTAQRNDLVLARGADYLLYNIMDTLAAGYMPVVDELDDAIDQMEDAIFEDTTRTLLNNIFSVKRAVLHLRRIIIPQREVMNRLARDTYTVVDPAERVYFRDVYDHYVRLADVNDTLRDLVSGALDTYLSVSANRTNEIMKVLTIFTALFMPISFLSGFFGMNFEFLPFDSVIAFIGMLAATVGAPVAMLLWFRKQGWMG